MLKPRSKKANKIDSKLNPRTQSKKKVSKSPQKKKKVIETKSVRKVPERKRVETKSTSVSKVRSAFNLPSWFDIQRSDDFRNRTSVDVTSRDGKLHPVGASIPHSASDLSSKLHKAAPYGSLEAKDISGTNSALIGDTHATVEKLQQVQGQPFFCRTLLILKLSFRLINLWKSE